MIFILPMKFKYFCVLTKHQDPYTASLSYFQLPFQSLSPVLWLLTLTSLQGFIQLSRSLGSHCVTFASPVEAVCSFDLCPAIILLLLYSNHLFAYLGAFPIRSLLLFAQYLLNAKCWDSTEQNEQDDPLQRGEIDNKQESKGDNFKQ